MTDQQQGAERWLSLGIGGVLLGLFGWGLYRVLPTLITLATNTIILGAEVLVIVGVGYALWEWRKYLAMAVKRLGRALYVLTFKADPTGGLGAHIEQLEERIETAQEEAKRLGGQKQRVVSALERVNEIYESGLSRAKAARQRGLQDEAEVEGYKAEAAKRGAEPLSKLNTYLDKTTAQTNEIVRKAELQVGLLKTVIEVEVTTYEATKGATSALRNAVRALKGDAASNDIFELNRDYLRKQTAYSIGEFDTTLALTKSTLDSIDLDRAAFSDAAFEELDARQRGTLTAIGQGADAAKLLLTPGNQAAPQAAPSDFASVFSKKGQ